jgi:hypothetical protein
MYLITCAVANNDGKFYSKDKKYLIRLLDVGVCSIIGDDEKEHWIAYNNPNFSFI